MTFAGEETRRRVEADPTSARNIDFDPGVKVSEILCRSGRARERRLIGCQLYQIAGNEARRDAQLAEDIDQQPA